MSSEPFLHPVELDRVAFDKDPSAIELARGVAVVPEPANGSRTHSPGSVWTSIGISMRREGLRSGPFGPQASSPQSEQTSVFLSARERALR